MRGAVISSGSDRRYSERTDELKYGRTKYIICIDCLAPKYKRRQAYNAKKPAKLELSSKILKRHRVSQIRCPIAHMIQRRNAMQDILGNLKLNIIQLVVNGSIPLYYTKKPDFLVSTLSILKQTDICMFIFAKCIL